MAISYGELCGQCRHGCANCYSEMQSASLADYQCVACKGTLLVEGKPCEVCKGSGEYTITSCPREMVTPDVWDVLDGAQFARRGSWPVAGGTLDQAHGFIQAVRHVWREEAAYRTKGED